MKALSLLRFVSYQVKIQNCSEFGSALLRNINGVFCHYQPANKISRGMNILRWCHCQTAANDAGVKAPQVSHDFIKNLPNYKHLYYIYDPKTVAEEVSDSRLNDFISLSRSSPDSPIFHSKYNEIMKPLLSSLKELTDLELQHLLYHIQFFPYPKDNTEWKEHEKVWIPLDDECCRRGVDRKNWRASVNYVYVDLFSMLKLGKYSTYHWIFLRINYRKLDLLPREKLVRLCQTICASKRLPKELKLFNLEYNILRIMNPSEENGFKEITLPELSAVCHPFYKMRYALHNKDTVDSILQLCTKNSENISSASLSIICKALSLSRLNTVAPLGNFVDSITHQLPRLDLHSCASLLRLLTSQRYRSSQLLDRISDNIKRNVNSLEIFECEWILQAYENLDSKSSPVFQTVYDRLLEYARQKLTNMMNEEMSESDSDSNGENFSDSSDEKHVKKSTKLTFENVLALSLEKRLVKVLNSLSYGEIYPKKLISIALSPEFLAQCYGKSPFGYPLELLTLDQNVAAEAENYSGPRLSEKSRQLLTKKNMTWPIEEFNKKLRPYESLCRQVYLATLSVVGNPELLFMSNILPHFLSLEIVLCTQNKHQPIPVPDSFKSKVHWDRKFLTSDDTLNGIEYHAILVHNLNMTFVDSDEPLGPRKRFIEKVQKMGYKTYEISYNSWKNLKTQESMQEQIRCNLHAWNLNKFIKH